MRYRAGLFYMMGSSYETPRGYHHTVTIKNLEVLKLSAQKIDGFTDGFIFYIYEKTLT